MTRRNARHVLIVILLVAAGVRMAGVRGAGYPYSFYGDEVNNIERTVRFHDPDSGFDLNPHWFNKPALGYYVYFGEFGFYYLLGRYVAGSWDTPKDFALHFIDPATRGPFYLIARTSNVLFALLTIFFLYRLARRFFDREIALIAAAVLALCDGHVVWSQVAKQDIPATALAVIAMGFVAKVALKGRARDYLLAGLFAGLGTAMKYTPIILLVPLFLAHREYGEARRVRWLCLGGAALMAGFFLGSPYNFLDSTWAGGNLVALRDHTLQMLGFGAGEVDPSTDSIFSQLGWGFLEFLGFGYSRGGGAFGIPMTVVLLLGVRHAWRQAEARRPSMILMSLVVGTILLLAISSPQRFRKNHLVLIYPICAILTAFGFRFLWELMQDRLRHGSALLLATVVLLCPIPMFPGWQQAHRIREQNTQRSELLAMDTLVRLAPAGSTIINDTEILPLSLPAARLEWILERIDQRVGAAQEGLLNARSEVERRHHQTMLDHFQVNRMKYELLQSAPSYASRSPWDVIVLLKVWQTEQRQRLQQETFGNSDLWQRLPMGDGFPQEIRNTVRCYQIDPEDLPVGGPAQRDTVVQSGLGVDFVVTADVSYDNYQTPQKRANWPEWARFYDDLRAHYNCWLINGEHEGPGPAIRIYDVRSRLADGATPRVEVLSR